MNALAAMTAQRDAALAKLAAAETDAKLWHSAWEIAFRNDSKSEQELKRLLEALHNIARCDANGAPEYTAQIMVKRARAAIAKATGAA